MPETLEVEIKLSFGLKRDQRGAGVEKPNFEAFRNACEKILRDATREIQEAAKCEMISESLVAGRFLK